MPVKTTKSDYENITQELYKKNLELVNANKEMALFQELYEVMVTSLKTSEVAQRFVDTIVKDLDFLAGSATLYDPKANKLITIACTKSLTTKKVTSRLNKPFQKITFSKSNKHNLHIKAFKSRKKFTSESLFDALDPIADKHSANVLAHAIGIESLVIYPIAFGKKALGTFSIYLQKPATALTSFEKEVLKRISILFGLALDRIMLYQDLKMANRNLRKLDKLKDEFVYIATHELKNPVTAMRGYLELIKSDAYGKIPTKMTEPINQLQASSHQLVTLVNDLLQIARAEANNLTIRTKEMAICPIIDAITASLKPLADQKNIKIEHTCLIKSSDVKADPDKIREVINNLISNAIKYSEKGKIQIYHALENNLLITHVKDNGVGIPKKDQSKIFSRFFRVEKEAAKGIPGTGLGLFIVKQLVERMGGRIWFASTEGTGTTFSFALPKA